jgi:hypothetical protein
MTVIDPAALENLRAQLRGPVVGPEDPEYDAQRRVYNAMIDRHPALIVRCVDAADVIATVNFAREQGILLSVRGGGHNAGGLGVCDDGVVADLSSMRGVRVDPDARTVLVQGGSVWGDVDHAAHAFGLAVPSGIISTTGVGGLTLGGGIGHLSRKYGLAIDNLLAVDMVLADGSFVTASADSHPDLFWAVRGGGGNFGVVTAFLFRGQPVHTVYAGPTFWDLERTPEMMRWYREFLPKAPDDLNGFFATLTVPPAPPFPEALRMKKVCAVVWCYTGSPAEAEAIFAPVLATNPLMHGVGPMPFPAVQSMFDPLFPPGQQWYWRADFVNELTDAAIVEHAKWAERLPTWQSTMHLYPIDGAVHRVGRTETAFSYRDAQWAEVMVGVDPDPAKAPEITSWTKGYWDAVHPHSAGGAYVNFMMDEGQERVQATYRDNYRRLADVKRRYDPENLFRVNQNIRPA